VLYLCKSEHQHCCIEIGENGATLSGCTAHPPCSYRFNINPESLINCITLKLSNITSPPADVSGDSSSDITSDEEVTENVNEEVVSNNVTVEAQMSSDKDKGEVPSSKEQMDQVISLLRTLVSQQKEG